MKKNSNLYMLLSMKNLNSSALSTDMASHSSNTVAASSNHVCSAAADPFCIEHKNAQKCVGKLSEISTKVRMLQSLLLHPDTSTHYTILHRLHCIGYEKQLFIWQCDLCIVFSGLLSVCTKCADFPCHSKWQQILAAYVAFVPRGHLI